jgi:hypothetical protein
VVAAEAENVADATGDSVIFSRPVSRIGLMMMSTGFKCQPMIGLKSPDPVAITSKARKTRA